MLVIPGFLAPDVSTLPMRRALRKAGYNAAGWGLGLNTGPRPEVVDAMQETLRRLYDETGRSVSIVGWSLGGMYARLLARAHPELVRVVVTLVSPFRFIETDGSRVSRLYRTLERPEERHTWRAMRQPPLLVPTTSLFTKLDGVVDWRACIDEPRPNAENIELRGASHFGMGHNPAALIVITDRLEHDHDNWEPFDPEGRLKNVIVPHRSHPTS